MEKPENKFELMLIYVKRRMHVILSQHAGASANCRPAEHDASKQDDTGMEEVRATPQRVRVLAGTDMSTDRD